jgi:hypothetical protein
MVHTLHAAWIEHKIVSLLLKNNTASLPSVVSGRQIHPFKAKKMDGDLI